MPYPLVGRHFEDRRYESVTCTGTGYMPYLEDSTPDPTQAHRPDFSRARTIAQDRDPLSPASLDA